MRYLRRHTLELLLFGCALALRLVVVCRLHLSPYGAPVSGDMKFYADWAMRIAHGQLTDFHAFYGQPLYAYLLGGAFAVIGFHPFAIAIVQATLDALTAVLIFRIGVIAFPESARGGKSVGALAAIGWMFFVPAAAYCGLLIPTSWTIAGFWFCVWWLLARRAVARPFEWFLIGVFIGVIAMMSAAVLFVCLLFLAAAAARRSAIAATLVLAGVGVGTAPCWLHNCLVARDPVFLSAHSGVNFWIGNNPEANGYPKVPLELPSEQAALLRESVSVAERAAGHPLARSEVSTFWSARAHEYIRTHFGEWLRLVALKAKNFWNAFEYDDLSSITALHDAAIVPPGISFGFIAAFGLAGALISARKPAARWIIAVVLLQMFALLPMFVNERYRLAAAPGLLLLSAFFLVKLWRLVATRSWVPIAAAAGSLAVGIVVTTLPATDPTLSSVNDYKTGRRQLAANDYPRAEFRLRRALAAVVPPPQIATVLANSFADSAQTKLQAGDSEAALRTIDEAIRINPTDQRLAASRARIAERHEQ